MENQRTIGITGTLVRDFYFPAATLVGYGPEFRIRTPEVECSVSTPEPLFPGAKVTLESLPDALVSASKEFALGGGGYNSLRALLDARPDLPVRYLDSGDLPEHFVREVAGYNVTSRSLHLRQTPSNAIIGNRSSKVILKSPITPVAELDGDHQSAIDWLLQCDAILANSLKDPAVVKALVDGVRHRRVSLFILLTQSLANDLVERFVLPSAAVIIATWDQAGYIVTRPDSRTVDNALEVVTALARKAAAADLFLTLGKDGVLAYSQEMSTAYHVRLRAAAWERAQELARAPVHLCGCGDAFAAGVVLGMLGQAGSLISAGGAVLRGALMGSVVALSWLGWSGGPDFDEFEVRDFVLGGRRPCSVAAPAAMISATDHSDSSQYPVRYDEAHRCGIPHRSVHVEITNADGDFLLRRRAGDGRFEIPGGHVEWLERENRGETYDEAAAREIVEELGLERNWRSTAESARQTILSNLRAECKIINQLPSRDSDNNNEWVAVFTLDWAKQWGDPAAFEGSLEGDSACWMPLSEIINMSLKNPAEINAALRLFLQRRGVLIPSPAQRPLDR